MNTVKSYWDKRYEAGKLWGDQPCPSVALALPFLVVNGAGSILVPGCGYGRNSRAFAERGFHVLGTDVSSEALRQATADKPEVMEQLRYERMDIREMAAGESFDAVFLSNVLHLFLEKDRKKVLAACDKHLHKGGLLLFTCLSTADKKNYGTGAEVEPHTFHHNGKTLRFYDKRAVMDELPDGYTLLECREHIQTELYPSGQREDLVLWFVAARKKGAE
ncbi:class I SAM-dependent methyltransferase [Bacillus sp. SB49]|uniref:class I SAM-dependent methyltransferase n=1 Tax=Bacillus sp. SB49 TaxID=1071080 RepID=UPI0003F54BE1|nr:class I SAM-dependent methyltransferase [Bacillus sp. SB49]QHT46165.1 class I SAM-dependent methyltransferase [Bacillus sp. SB49]